jgi:4-hydroxy-tetrahydrodipicolinate synthase
VGADGILSGHGSLIADLYVEIFEAVRRGDLAVARRVSDRIYPLVEIFYAQPFLDGHNRMKEALTILGRIDEAHVRPPLRRARRRRERVRCAVAEAGLPGGARTPSGATSATSRS